MFGFILVIVSQ